MKNRHGLTEKKELSLLEIKEAMQPDPSPCLIEPKPLPPLTSEEEARILGARNPASTLSEYSEETD